MARINSFSKGRRKGEVIHSGHFMISSVADDQEEAEDISHDRDSPRHHEHSIMIKHGGGFSHAPMETRDMYHFGSPSSNQVTIDASLARLFECMSLAYQGGKVVSPKWKNFKGMKLSVKDKIRLNNAIWRTWHIQYIMQKKKGQSLIQFATPFEIDYNTHSRPEAVVLEGKYWKRRIETVVAEYKKWRAFYLTKWVPENNTPSTKEWTTDLEPLAVQDDLFMSEFTDTLFTSLSQQPFQFPNPREIAQHATNSDMMQPGLLQLQPIMDDFIDFDPFQDLLFSPKKPTLPGNANQTFNNSSLDVFTENVFDPVDRTLEQSTPKPASNPPANGNSGQLYLPSKSAENSFNSNLISSSVQSVNHSRVMQKIIASTPVSVSTIQSVQTTQADGRLYQVVIPAGGTQQQSDHVHTTNFVSFYPTNSPGQLEKQANYQTSKNVVNAPANKIIYGQTQTSSSSSVFPPTFPLDSNRLVQQRSQPSHPVRIAPAISQVSQGATLRPQSVQQPSQNCARDLLPTGSDVTSSAFVNSVFPIPPSTVGTEPPLFPSKPAPKQPHRKRGYEAETSSTKDITMDHNFQRPLPSKVLATGLSNLAAKRRSVDELRSATVQEPQSSRSSSTGATNLSDIDMETVVLEQTSPSHDNDLSQMENFSKQGAISTEQKRRLNINSAFNRLQQLLPGGNSQANLKLSKANLMSKTVQHIKSLQSERNKIVKEVESLKGEVAQLQSSITSAQLQLPATGIQLSSLHDSNNRENFRKWCRHRTRQDWKFYLFATVIDPWFDSYQRTVSAADYNNFHQTLSLWLQEHCSLRVLRTGVVHSLQKLSTTTTIITNPTQMRQQIEEEVKEQQIRHYAPS